MKTTNFSGPQQGCQSNVFNLTTQQDTMIYHALDNEHTYNKRVHSSVKISISLKNEKTCNNVGY